MRSLLPSVMRPKSMATVVDDLVVDAAPASSTPSDTCVMAASVVSGSISEIEPTKVVLPTANPPATTILTGTGTLRSPAVVAPERSESLESIQHPFKQTDIGLFGDRSTAAVQESAGHQIADEYTYGADDDIEMSRHLGERDGRLGEGQDAPLFDADLPHERATAIADEDECLQRKVEARPCAAAREGIRPDPEGAVV